MDEPRLTVNVATMELAISLYRLLASYPGPMGVASGSIWTVEHRRSPKSAEEEDEIRALIDAWARDNGVENLDVTIHPRSTSFKGSPTNGIVTWKVEEGPENAGEDGSPDDSGPAWLTLYDGETELDSDLLNDGAWLTRAAAESYAAEHGYVFEAQ